MGSAVFEAQYQQQPLPAEGNLIKKDWLRYGDAPSLSTGRVTLSFDTATKENTEADFSACTVWLEAEGKHHLINVWREKVDFPRLRRKVLDMIDSYRSKAILIEDAGSGSALIQELQRMSVPAIARKARDPKAVRLSSASHYVEAGLMWLPKDAPWLAKLVAELLGFPAARYDDQVDSLSQYFNWIRERPREFFEYHPLYDGAGVDHDSIAGKLAMLRRFG
jgi:predicted phage terminase large subunit-like protein